jgi:hypothetical protein
VFIAVCDGLKGLPEAITTTWERTVAQQCIVHLIRNSFRYVGRQHRDGMVKARKPIYTARPSRPPKERFAEFTAEWGPRYPAIVRLWESSWAEFVPLLEAGPTRRFIGQPRSGRRSGRVLRGRGRCAGRSASTRGHSRTHWKAIRRPGSSYMNGPGRRPAWGSFGSSVPFLKRWDGGLSRESIPRSCPSLSRAPGRCGRRTQRQTPSNPRRRHTSRTLC